MAQSIPTGADSADSGAASAKQERKSDPNLTLANLAFKLETLADGFDAAKRRLDLNADRQDEMISSAHVALEDARRILAECRGLNERIDKMPTTAQCEAHGRQIAALSDRMDKAIEARQLQGERLQEQMDTNRTEIAPTPPARATWYAGVNLRFVLIWAAVVAGAVALAVNAKECIAIIPAIIAKLAGQ